MFAIFGAGVAFLVALLLTRLFLRPESRMHILDYPNERSLHSQPTPRTGGVAIVFGIVAGGIVVVLGSPTGIPGETVWLGGLAALIASVSYMDDRRHLPLGFRLTAHFVAAVLLIVAGVTVNGVVLPGAIYAAPAWFMSSASVLFVVWMINLYNFMDGMDGFAGGMTAIGFGTLALFGWLGGDALFAALNFVIGAAAGGFLVFNFPPAKIFMGDSGSSALGFLAAGMALWGNASGIVPLWMTVLVFSPFIVDATITLLRRILRGKKVWQAHRTHYYQRLVQAGWSHRRTTSWEYVIMAACSASALLGLRARPGIQWAIIALWIGIYGVMAYLVVHIEHQARKPS